MPLHCFGEPPSGSVMPLLILPVSGDASNVLRQQRERVDPLVASGKLPPHALAVFGVGSWNDDLSPWPAPPTGRGRDAFAGRAEQTLTWILESLLPEIEAAAPRTRGGKKGLLGYSLAGLFALWAATRTDRFAACASCSGSLWYQGFADYIAGNPPTGPCRVYLSLGEGEEHTRNPLFAQVGDATRRIEALLRAAPTVREVALTWHPGKHRDPSGERLAAAQRWMLTRL